MTDGTLTEQERMEIEEEARECAGTLPPREYGWVKFAYMQGATKWRLKCKAEMERVKREYWSFARLKHFVGEPPIDGSRFEYETLEDYEQSKRSEDKGGER